MNANTPAVSVLMPTYNRAAYLADSIESVLGQRFTDFELLIVDDRSSDDGATIAANYAAHDSRVRVYRNERNLGQFANRNLAATYARGRFIKYHDSDDVMYPHCLEIMVSLLDAEPRAGLALSTGRAWSGGPAPILSSPRQSYQREFMGFGVFMCGPASALFRTDLFRALGGWPDEGVHSDTLLLMDALARHHVLLVPGDLFWYRVHSGQALSSPRAAHDYARLNRAIWNKLASDDCPLDSAERDLARRAQAWTVAKQTVRDVRAGRVALAAYRLRESGMSAIDWVRYFRRPVRTAHAGTPLNAHGEPLTERCVDRTQVAR